MLGGGIMKRKSLLKIIHTEFQKLLNSYISNKKYKESNKILLVYNYLDIDEYIKRSEFGDNTGLLGAS